MEPNDVDSCATELVIKEGKLPECIESPFKWKVHVINSHETSEEIVNRLLEKDEDIINDTDFAWRSFIIQLVICYELDRQCNLKESIAKIKECEWVLKSKDEYCADKFYKSISKALWHVTLACKAYLMLKSDLMTEAQQVLQAIMPAKLMDKPNQAGLYGIKAAVLMEYGFAGCNAAVEVAKEAVEKDDKQAEWHFLLGKSISSSRRVYSCYDKVQDSEIKAMKEAVHLATLNSSKPLRYLVYLGNVYREYALRTYKRNVSNPTYAHSNTAELVNTLDNKARDIYRTVMKLSPNNSRLLARCCFGLIKMPTRIPDAPMIDSGIQNALRLSPNNAMVLHVAGLFYDRCLEDFDNALKYFTMAAEVGCYGAWNNMIKLKYNSIMDFNPMDDLIDLLKSNQSTPRRHQTLCQIGAYQLIQKRNLPRAIDYLMKVYKENPDSYSIKMLKPNFLVLHDPIDIMQVLVHEVQFVLKTKLDLLDNDYKKRLRQFIVKIGFVDSKLLSDEIVDSPVGELIKKSMEILKYRVDRKKKKIKVMNCKVTRFRQKKFVQITKEKKEQMKEEQNKRKQNKKVAVKLTKWKMLTVKWKELRQMRRERERGLPLDVVKRIKECGLQKPHRTIIPVGQLLSESRKDNKDFSSNESLYKSFTKKFNERNQRLIRSVSTDSMPQYREYGSHNSTTGSSEEDISSKGLKTKEGALSWRTERGEDRAFGKDKSWKQTSVSSSDESSFRDHDRPVRKKSEQALSWRREGGENRAFGETNIITDSKVKRTNSDSSFGSGYERDLTTKSVRHERNWSRDEARLSESYGGQSGETYVKSYSSNDLRSLQFKSNLHSAEDGNVKRKDGEDRYRGERQNIGDRFDENPGTSARSFSTSNRMSFEPEFKSSFNEGAGSKNRSWGDRDTQNRSDRNLSQNTRARSFSTSDRMSLEPEFKSTLNEGAGSKNRAWGERDTQNRSDRNLSQNTRARSSSISDRMSLEPEFKSTMNEGAGSKNRAWGDRDRQNLGDNRSDRNFSQNTRARSFSSSDRMSLEPEFKNKLNEGAGSKNRAWGDRQNVGDNHSDRNLSQNTRARSFSTSNPMSFKPEFKSNLNEGASKNRAWGDRPNLGDHSNRNQGKDTRARSFSTSDRMLFEPDFKSNFRTGCGKDTFKGGSLVNPAIETRARSDDTTEKSTTDFKWGNSRWMSENKADIKQITSAKAKTQDVIREPYGPEEGRRGFKFVRRSRNS